jgi:hypothetical protein
MSMDLDENALRDLTLLGALDPGGRRVQASGPIRYRIIQKNQEWLIAGIDY